jgi:hypothetical protein
MKYIDMKPRSGIALSEGVEAVLLLLLLLLLSSSLLLLLLLITRPQAPNWGWNTDSC